jgi:ketosteroid isomerase-like protein
MSQGEIERIKAAWAAYNEGDFDAVMDMLDDGVEIRRLGGLETLRGKEAIRDWLAPDAYEFQRFDELTEFQENGDRILVACDWHARGRGSGIDVDGRMFLVFTVRGDKWSRLEVYLDEDEGLRATGLLE